MYTRHLPILEKLFFIRERPQCIQIKDIWKHINNRTRELNRVAILTFDGNMKQREKLHNDKNT